MAKPSKLEAAKVVGEPLISEVISFELGASPVSSHRTAAYPATSSPGTEIAAIQRRAAVSHVGHEAASSRLTAAIV